MAELGVVDPTSEAYWHDIHGVLAPLRERAPVARSTVGLYEILRYEHCEPLLRNAPPPQGQRGASDPPADLLFETVDERGAQ